VKTQHDLLVEYQRLSAVAALKRRAVDSAIKELVEAEREAERVGCALDLTKDTRGEEK
jgi:hypothetical protein